MYIHFDKLFAMNIASWIASLSFIEMYEISPYATFSVPGRENRSVTTATLDYTMQFKTFGHLENEDINTIDYDRSSVEFER